MSVISKYHGIKYLKEIFAILPNLDPLDSIITSANKPDLIFALNDALAMDVYNKCKSHNLEKRIKIVGVDGLPIERMGMDMVAGKYIAATVLYPTGGQEAIITALKILENKPFNKENSLVTTIIDSSNVRIMKLQSQKMISQQKEIEQRQLLINKQLKITQNQSAVIFLILLALGITILLGGILFYYLRENKKINKRLEKQNI